MPKTSDLAGNKKRPEWLSPAQLARLQDCSERTIREWCKRGLIQEAYQSRGGHWRIRMPLSIKTRYELERRSADWPFKGMKGDIGGDFSPDLAECLLLAQLFEVDISEEIPVPYLAELPDFLDQGLIKQPVGEKESTAARQIQDLIIEREATGKSFSDLLLIGWVYQYSRQNKARPTVGKIADFMGMSRGVFYRRYTAQQLHKAYLIATGEFKRDLPDPKGLDPVQRANLKAKKSTFESLQRDLY